jgi:hypothetical protein
MTEAEAMYVRALQGCGKARGAEHTSALSTVNNPSILYKNQGKMAGGGEDDVRAGATKALEGVGSGVHVGAGHGQ